MGGVDRAGNYAFVPFVSSITDPTTGGKAKPLKAPKKEKVELDDEDKAFHEKQRAGMSPDRQQRSELIASL
jgi:hypothetical protein